MEMQVALERQSDEMKNTTSSAMSQMLNPVMEAMHQLATTQQQMQSWMAQQQAQQQALLAMNVQNLAAQAAQTPVPPTSEGPLGQVERYDMYANDEDWELEDGAARKQFQSP